MHYIIGVLLFSEPESKELQEAVSKTTFQHDLTNLEPATTYSIYLKAYSPLGASERSSTVVSTTLGGGMYLHTDRTLYAVWFMFYNFKLSLSLPGCLFSEPRQHF